MQPRFNWWLQHPRWRKFVGSNPLMFWQGKCIYLSSSSSSSSVFYKYLSRKSSRAWWASKTGGSRQAAGVLNPLHDKSSRHEPAWYGMHPWDHGLPSLCSGAVIQIRATCAYLLLSWSYLAREVSCSREARANNISRHLFSWLIDIVVLLRSVPFVTTEPRS